MGKVANDLGGRGDFDDIATELVGFDILLLDFEPLRAETELSGLELQVGVLTSSRQREYKATLYRVNSPSGHLVIKDTRIGRPDIRLETTV